MGYKDLSVDAFFPIIAFYNNGTKPDSIAEWLDRYARYTHQDIRHAESLAAVEYFLQKGDYFKYQEQTDSALSYYQKLVNQQKNYIKGIGYGRILDLYRMFSQEDSTYKYRILYNNLYVHNYFKVQKDKFLENEDEWRQRNEFITNELELQRRSTTLFYVLVIVLLICAFMVYLYFMLRAHHRETLEQNREYADTIRSLRSQTKNDILDTEIARRFHELSSQDSHPTAEDWQALRDAIDRQHPQLLTTLQQQYAEHQPDQTLTEQERHVIGLIVIRCSPLQMSVLLITSKPNVSNLRRRLYHKLTGKDGSSTDLDKYVAALCE
jgi:DNA-binding CsgD family transcriptional regulator